MITRSCGTHLTNLKIFNSEKTSNLKNVINLTTIIVVSSDVGDEAPVSVQLVHNCRHTRLG